MAALLKHVALATFVFLVLTDQSNAFMSEFKANFTFECPANHALTTAEGLYNRYQSDRIWHFDCFSQEEVPITNCVWKKNINNVREDVIFKCGGDQVIAGVASDFIGKYRDRIWGFKCCNLSPNFVIHNCDFTGWQNQVNTEEVNYNVPDNHLISGVWSVFDSHQNDRKHQFDVCKVAQLMPVVG